MQAHLGTTAPKVGATGRITGRDGNAASSGRFARRRALAFAVAVAGSLAGAWAADPAPAPSPSVRLLRNLVAGPTNQMATTMFAAGVHGCASRVDQIGNFLTSGTQSSALLFLPDREPDRSMVSVSLEVQAEGLPRTYASATFSPNTAIGCAAMYEAIQYWNEPCNAVANKGFKGAAYSGPLGSDIGILTIGPSAQVFLMRAGQGCVSIKKEVVR